MKPSSKVRTPRNREGDGNGTLLHQRVVIFCGVSVGTLHKSSGINGSRGFHRATQIAVIQAVRVTVAELDQRDVFREKQERAGQSIQQNRPRKACQSGLNGGKIQTEQSVGHIAQ